MPTMIEKRHALLLAGCLAPAALLTACESPVVVDAGQTASIGGVDLSVGTYELRHVELHVGDDTVEYADPVLIIPITVTNTGEDPMTYSPTHTAQAMTESSTPLLYPDPGGELPPATKTPIPGVTLAKGQLEGQLEVATQIAPGESITDKLLFQAPAEGTDALVLSLPPTMHRGKVPALFRISYSAPKPTGPKVYGLGEAIAFGDVTFTVTGTTQAYLETEDTAQGEGYSAEPLLKIAYAIENKGEAEVTYEPNHRAVGADAKGARVMQGSEGVSRVQFAATTTPKDQLQDDTKVAPGAKVEDFVLFERPEEKGDLFFEYPAALFGQKGLVRVTIPFEPAEVTEPEAIKKVKEKDKDKDKK
jgi:hypothetical protein